MEKYKTHILYGYTMHQIFKIDASKNHFRLTKLGPSKKDQYRAATVSPIPNQSEAVLFKPKQYGNGISIINLQSGKEQHALKGDWWARCAVSLDANRTLAVGKKHAAIFDHSLGQITKTFPNDHLFQSGTVPKICRMNNSLYFCHQSPKDDNKLIIYSVQETNWNPQKICELDFSKKVWCTALISY